MEEEKARQVALKAREENRIMELEKERKNLLEMVNKHQVIIARCVEKIEMWEARDKELEDLAEADFKEEAHKKDDGDDTYVELVDYNARYDSVESFGSKLGIKQKDDGTKELEFNAEEALRRCYRLADKQDAKIEELANERAAAKDNYGMNSDLDSKSSSLLYMAGKIGIDLGCSTSMISQNLNIIA